MSSVRLGLPAQRGEPRADLRDRHEDGQRLHHLVWRLGQGVRVCSSAVLGGGIGPRAWILNAQVPGGYPRLDPDRHLAEIAAAEGLTGP
ncbi:adenosylcobinamide amidohydrolase, partial [Streptomyces parvus]|uniref:adenosylcobinamide amidohydrolase n=1 Tax=Streptomyces parvus TaxID=66428 RepID=UPI003BAC4CAE